MVLGERSKFKLKGHDWILAENEHLQGSTTLASDGNLDKRLHLLFIIKKRWWKPERS